MKIKAYQLTLLILTAILGAGIGSAVIAYKMGFEALKGVSPPDVNPTKKFSTSQQFSAPPQPFRAIDEKTILKEVGAYIQKQKANPKVNNQPVKATEPKPKPSPSPQKTEETAPKNGILINFPLKVKDRNMTLEITKATYQGESVLLSISLKNEGEEAVQFLYSFLEVQDSQGQILSAITEGLPNEIPANGKSFQGTVEIPLALLEKSNLISLKLTDYPAQKFKLDISNIPLGQPQEATLEQ